MCFLYLILYICYDVFLLDDVLFFIYLYCILYFFKAMCLFLHPCYIKIRLKSGLALLGNVLVKFTLKMTGAGPWQS